MIAALLVAGAIALVIAAAWASRYLRHPEDAATHPDPEPDTTSERFYRTADRPAGPDAEEPVDPTQ